MHFHYSVRTKDTDPNSFAYGYALHSRPAI